MNRRSGFSLIELVLSLGLFSMLLTVFLKLNSWEQARAQTILEEQNLMSYVGVLAWELKRTRSPIGIWSGYQDAQTRERKFVRGRIKESVCLASIDKSKETEMYRIVLRGTNSRKVPPIELFMVK